MPNYDNIYGFEQIYFEGFKASVAELAINMKEEIEQEILQKAGDSNILIFKQSEPTSSGSFQLKSMYHLKLTWGKTP